MPGISRDFETCLPVKRGAWNCQMFDNTSIEYPPIRAEGSLVLLKLDILIPDLETKIFCVGQIRPKVAVFLPVSRPEHHPDRCWNNVSFRGFPIPVFFFQDDEKGMPAIPGITIIVPESFREGMGISPSLEDPAFESC